MEYSPKFYILNLNIWIFQEISYINKDFNIYYYLYEIYNKIWYNIRYIYYNRILDQKIDIFLKSLYLD